MKNFIQRIFSDERSQVPVYLLVAGASVIFLIGWIFTKDIMQSVDVLFWDEANYMQSGRLVTEKFNRSWGPAYAIWYKIISFIEYDTLKLYYLNFRLMTVLPAIALFVFLALSNIRLWVSFSIGLLFIFADINLPVWPKVSHYCIFIFLTGLILMKYIPSVILKLSFISLFALNISYARPEFYLTYLSILGLWCIALFYKEFRNKYAILISVILFLFGFGIQVFMGNPLFNFQGDRSALAFAQHFMFNYFEWNNIDQDFWITWMSYYDELFRNASSIKEAYLTNERMFHLHFLTNFQNYFSNAFTLFSDAMLPEKLVSIPLKGRVIILLVGGAIMLAVASQDRYLEIVHNGFKRNRLAIVLLLLMIAPTLISCFVIYPRTHYMIFHYIVVIFLVCLIVFSKPVPGKPYDLLTFIFIGVVSVLVIMFIPSTKDYKHFDLWRKEASQANLKTVEKLRSYNFKDTIHLLENEGGMNIFLDKNYLWVRGFLKDTAWTAYLEKEHVDIVYVTPSLVKYPTLRSDSTWYEFEAHPEKFGYEKVLTGNHTPYLYIHKNLLKEQ